MKIVLQNVFWLLVFVAYQYLCLASDQEIRIGVLSNQIESQPILPINTTTKIQRFTYHKPINLGTIFQDVFESDSFEAGISFCKFLEENEIVAIFGPQPPSSMPILESISTSFQMPYLTTNWKEDAFTTEKTAINFYPKASLLARGIAEIVRNLQWTNFAYFYETDENLIRMQEVLMLREFQADKDNKVNKILIKQLEDGTDYRPLLKEMNGTISNIILDCRTEIILPILKQAKELNILDLQDNYFLTSLDAHTLDFSVLNTMANITAIRIFDYKTEDFGKALHDWKDQFRFTTKRRLNLEPHEVETDTVLKHDAISLLTETLFELNSGEAPIEAKAINCEKGDTFERGGDITKWMIGKSDFAGLTSPISFDEFGNRVDFNIYVVNVITDQVLGVWFAKNESMLLTRTEEDIMEALKTGLKGQTLIISSRKGAPYLFLAKGDNLQGNARYEGFSVDLIDAISKEKGFKYEFFLTEDNKYGNWDDNAKRWTGIVGDVYQRRAHLGICDLTITHERRKAVDFSMPFMTLGIGILYRTPDKKDIDMFAFLDPFHFSVWMYTATLYLFISVVLYFISRMTPDDWESPHPCDENPEELENIWDLKNCLWLTLGSIMTQGCDILPKGISSRISVSMWWFFSLIMTSSYTANLAAFLTKANLEAPIDSAEALAKQTKIKYGLLEGGSTQSFFENSNLSLYQRMWTQMKEARPSVFVTENKDGVNKVQTTRNALYAFFMESTSIEYEVETKCELKQIGSLLDSKSYGIAMSINFPYRTEINRVILEMQEKGKLAELKKKWWQDNRDEPSCDKNTEEEDGADLALENVGGVFIVLGIGVVMSYALAIIEFLWNVRTVSVEEHMTYWEALKVETKFACNFWITKKRTKPVVSEGSSSSSKSSSNDKADNKSMIHSIIGSFMNISSLKIDSKS